MKKELEKILEDPEFVKEFMLKKTREEAKKAIEEKGVSVTDEEMNEIHDLYSAIYEKCKKMNQKDLLEVSGGVDKDTVLTVLNFVWGAGKAAWNGVKGNREIKREMEKANELKKENDELRRQIDRRNAEVKEDWDKKKNQLVSAGMGVVGLITLAGLLKDDIKSWVKKLG